MRALLLAPLLLLAVPPALAQSALPEGVAELVTCSTVYSMRSDEAITAGDEGTATEFFYMGEALLGQARAMMESAGYSAADIEDVEMNNALVTGFRYGAGEAEAMLAECLAAADTP